MKLTRLRITGGGFEGLESLDKELGPGLNLIQGRNGSGKTSTLHAIAAAITNVSPGTRTVLAHDGEDGGVIFFQLDNGWRGNRRVKPGGTSAGPVQLRDGDGKPLSAPQSQLNKLFAGMGFNPLGFLDLPPTEQTQELLKVIPVDLPLDEMTRLTDGEVGSINYQAHALMFLNDAEDYLELKRRDINRDAKKNRATAEELRAQVPDDFKAGGIVDFDLGVETAKLTECEAWTSQGSD